MTTDAIIVLGKGISVEGELPEVARRHVRMGASLYSATPAPLIMSGAYGLFEKPPSRTEAMAMREYALELGIPGDQIIVEEESRDTIGNAWFTKVRIAPRNWHSLILVTADYHMERALWIFTKRYGPMYGMRPAAVATDERAARTGTEQRFLAMAEVLLGDILDGDDALLAARIHGEHPAYGGRRTLQDLLTL
jgi:uncharacterized SAM-binding protein YcdF (DUF218 family)